MYAVLFFFIFFFIPGFILVHSCLPGFNRSGLGIFSTVIGIALFIAITFYLRFFNLPFQLLYFYALFFLGIAWIQKKQFLVFFQIKSKTHALIFAAVLFFCSYALSAAHIGSGFHEGKFVLSAARDSLWRLSIIQELTHAFPPQIPGFSGVILKNYHYLYDLLIAASSVLTGITVEALYFQYFSFLSAFLFVLAVYQLVFLIVPNRAFSLFGTVLTVFTGNLSYLLPFFSSSYRFVVSSNVFMSDQPFDQGHNPFNLLAYAFLLTSTCLFLQWERKGGIRLFLLFSLCAGVLSGIKIYAGIVLFSGLSLVFAYYLFFKRRFNWYFFIPYCIALPFIFFIKGNDFAILSFAPGWLLVKMVEDHDRLFLPQMALKEQYYLQTQSVFHLFVLKTQQILIYLVGNLNVRLFAIGVLFQSAVFKWFSSKNIMIFGMICTGLIMPFLFNQKRAPYDSIQFTPYALLLLSIVSLLVMYRIFIFLNKKTRFVGYGFIITVLFFAIPTNSYLLHSKITNPKDTIEKDEVEALWFLRDRSFANAIILTDQDSFKKDYLYVPAISGRKIYLLGVSLVQQTGISTENREKVVQDFFRYDEKKKDQEIKEKNDFLHREHISFLYLSKSGLQYSELMKMLSLKMIFDNQSVHIYQVL